MTAFVGEFSFPAPRSVARLLLFQGVGDERLQVGGDELEAGQRALHHHRDFLWRVIARGYRRECLPAEGVAENVVAAVAFSCQRYLLEVAGGIKLVLFLAAVHIVGPYEEEVIALPDFNAYGMVGIGHIVFCPGYQCIGVRQRFPRTVRPVDADLVPYVVVACICGCAARAGVFYGLVQGHLCLEFEVEGDALFSGLFSREFVDIAGGQRGNGQCARGRCFICHSYAFHFLFLLRLNI